MTLYHSRTKRLTITLEPDVVDYLERRLAEDKRTNETDLINDLLRNGIMSASTNVNREFAVRGFKTKLRAEMDERQIEGLLDEI